MKHAAARAFRPAPLLALCLSVCLALPAQAEEPKAEEGLNLVEEGMKLLFRGLVEEIEPQLEDMAKELEPAMRGLVQNLGPAMDELMAMVGELDAYHPPERLPNGDIILRRKSPLDPSKPSKPLPESETEIEL